MKSVWQLVTAMQSRSDGLTLCEWTGYELQPTVGQQPEMETSTHGFSGQFLKIDNHGSQKLK
jgi:hypothetical protein